MAIAWFAYLEFYYRAKTIYSIHPPFFYDLVTKVFDPSRVYYDFDKINTQYEAICCLEQIIPEDEFSFERNQQGKKLGNFAKKAVSPPKVCHDLYRLIEYLKPNQILELGTCLGISTLSMAMVSQKSKITTVEGNSFFSQFAQQQNAKFVENVSYLNHRFEDFFASNEIKNFDFIFIDGDHSYEASHAAMRHIMSCCSSDAVILFDDIHWSSDMYKAWKEIIQMKQVHASLETCRWGLVFLSEHITSSHISSIPYWAKPWDIGLW